MVKVAITPTLARASKRIIRRPHAGIATNAASTATGQVAAQALRREAPQRQLGLVRVINASHVTKWDIGLATVHAADRVVQRHQDLDLMISAIHVVTQATGPTTAQGARVNNGDEDEHCTFTSYITSYESLLYLDITKSC